MPFLVSLISVPASNIYLLSERCSGSNWVTSMPRPPLRRKRCGPARAYKHFFQLSCDAQPGHLVVVLARNIYKWLPLSIVRRGMRLSHQELSLEAFLRRSWEPHAARVLAEHTQQMPRSPPLLDTEMVVRRANA